MLELVSQNYWWPGLSRYVTKFVTGCDACNQMKTLEDGEADPQQSPWLMLASDLCRHDWRTPGLEGLQCHPGGGGSPVQADPHYTYSHLPRLCRSCPAVP